MLGAATAARPLDAFSDRIAMRMGWAVHEAGCDWDRGSPPVGSFLINILIAAIFAFSCIAITVAVRESSGGLESLEIVDHNDLE
jgi:hypothetical protein